MRILDQQCSSICDSRFYVGMGSERFFVARLIQIFLCGDPSYDPARPAERPVLPLATNLKEDASFCSKDFGKFFKYGLLDPDADRRDCLLRSRIIAFVICKKAFRSIIAQPPRSYLYLRATFINRQTRYIGAERTTSATVYTTVFMIAKDVCR